METNRVAVLIMIMLGFVQILEIEAIRVPTCQERCATICYCSGQQYAPCYASCIAKCHLSTSDYDCARSCGVNKSITIDFGIYYLIIFIFLSFFIVYN